jgi:signal transduction histidine kinase
MSLGLPVHLAPQASSRSFARALHAVGFSCLSAAFIVALAYQSALPHAVLWPAMVATLPLAFVLWLVDRSRTTFYSIAYLLVGAAAIYWYVLTFYSQLDPILSGDSFSIALPKIALLVVGGSGVGVGVGILWCTLGYVVAGLSTTAAVLISGHRFTFDKATFLAYCAVVAVLVLADIVRRNSRRAQPTLHRAAQDERLAALRYRIELQAAALMHDTVLSHLAAIAASTKGSLDPVLQQQMERDLEILIGEEWLSESSPTVDAKTRTDWQGSGLFAAIQESRLMGLEVVSTGELAAVGRLDRAASAALGLAVKQCLVNVLKHSGTTRAEVAVYGGDGDVSVMVIDAGRGFSEQETGSERLGLRTSVKKRIEAVGGSVQVWSTPGRGTSIMITVPNAEESPRTVGS